jgi:hypothetical protein
MDIVVIPHVLEIARPNVWKELAQLLPQAGASWFRCREKPLETMDVSQSQKPDDALDGVGMRHLADNEILPIRPRLIS